MFEQLGCIPERTQGPQQPQHTKHSQDLSTAVGDHGYQDVNRGDHHQHPIENIPAALQVGLLPETPAQSNHLHHNKYDFKAEMFDKI